MNSLQQTSIQYQHRILMLCSSELNKSRSDCMLWLLLLQQCCSSCSTFAAVADLFFSAPSFSLSIIPMFIFFVIPLFVPYFLSHLCWLLLTNLQPSSPTPVSFYTICLFPPSVFCEPALSLLRGWDVHFICLSYVWRRTVDCCVALEYWVQSRWVASLFVKAGAEACFSINVCTFCGFQG